MLGGVPNVLGKGSQLQPPICQVMSHLPMLIWVIEVADLRRYHCLPRWVTFLVMGGSKWDQMRLP
jgi:hypothetical protein